MRQELSRGLSVAVCSRMQTGPVTVGHRNERLLVWPAHLVTHAICVGVDTKPVTRVLMPLTFVTCPIGPRVQTNPTKAGGFILRQCFCTDGWSDCARTRCCCAPVPQTMVVLTVVRGIVRPLAQSATMSLAILLPGQEPQCKRMKST